MIKEWLEEYKPVNHEAAEQALREIMQEIALAGLQRSGFFEKAAFYGGTALRIFHGLQRFSEDLDFSLVEPKPGFSLQPYMKGIETEFSALGVKVSIQEKNKTTKTDVDSAFLKPDTTWNELVIKPFSFYVKCFILPDLFAGKMHALLFRKWKGRVKGRDWFDMEWYIRKGVLLNLDHLLIRAQDSGDWKEKSMSKEQFMTLLQNKIQSVSFSSIREDVVRFIPDDKVIEIWSAQYFSDLVQKVKFT